MLANDLKYIMGVAPIKDWELESLLIAELYLNKMKKFTVMPYSSDEISLSLTQPQAYAINKLLGNFSNNYNIYIRLLLEPQLLPGK